MSDKSLPEQIHGRVVTALEKRVRPRFADKGDRWRSAAARAIGVHPSTMSRIMSSERPQYPDYEFVEKLAAYLQDSPHTFFSGEERSGAVPPLRARKGYRAAMIEAKKRSDDEGRNIPDWAWERAGDFRADLPGAVRADWLLTVASTFAADPDLSERHQS